MIAVIDYGLGNLKSVHKAFKLLGYESKITKNSKEILDSQAIVFPGVGSYGDCMTELDSRNLISPIYKSIKSGKFFLGICLGLQILFNKSEESPGVEGLNIIDGTISKIKFGDDLKVPHMGWNKINIQKKCNIFNNIPNDSWMYFVHSYKFDLNAGLTLTKSYYGEEFSSSISFDNIFATQFHPEKSSFQGLKVLENFAKIVN